MTTVHIITVHHRGEKMLERCLETLLASRGIELEVVVMANACREPLPGIVERSPRVHLVRSETSLGFSAANNAAVAWARERLGEPDFYYFINNDTESDPDALRTLVEALEADPEAAVAGPLLRILGAPDHLNSLGIRVTEDGWGWDEGIGCPLAEHQPLPPTRPVLAVTGSALLVAAADFARVGGWNEVYDYYFEDIDLCLKLWRRGRRVLHVPAAVVYHQISATMSLGSERKEFLFWRNRLMLATIHWPAALLFATYRRTIVDEILSQPWARNRIQRRALRETLARLPALLRQRWRLAGDRSWRRFLEPPGSVPVITLPEVPDEASDEADRDEPSSELDWGRAARLEPSAPDGRRVLVVGWAPLPFENARMNYAPGARAWQLARPLAAEGHAVCLVCGRIPGAYADGEPPRAELERDGVLVYALGPEHDDDATLAALAEAFRPDVVVGASALPSRRAARVAGALPLWVDLFGDPMAEGQARAAAGGGGDNVAAYRGLLVELLERGDAFAAVSERQRHAVLGQLGLAGRLNRATAGHELVHTVPCSITPASAEGQDAPAPPGDVPDDAFVVLWSGGYNTWCDVETLHRALERAMAARPELLFVSTGGAIPGHDEATYARFRDLAAASPHARRYLFKGCLPEAEAKRYFARADVGVVTEKPLAERVLGSSGRVLRWLADGLPAIATRLSELGETLEREGLAWTYPVGDAEALADRLVDAARAGREALRETGERGRRYAELHFTPEATAAPLRAWVAAARRAPDHALVDGRDDRLLTVETVKLRERLRQVERENADLFDQLHGARSELGDVHQSRMWKLWMGYLRTRRLLLWPFRRD